MALAPKHTVFPNFPRRAIGWLSFTLPVRGAKGYALKAYIELEKSGICTQHQYT